MQLKPLNSGIIFTDQNCIGCNKCLSGCVAIGANVVVKGDKPDTFRVEVDPNKCILCGHCIDECVHKARTYRDDTDEFFEGLEQGEHISVIISPAFVAGYESQYNHILGYLRHLGVRHIFNSGFGADIMVWVYMNLIHSFGLQGVISQFCPVIVNYLEKYKPQMLKYLMPVQSPVMCTAIYINSYLGIGDKLAYISPCIAGKHEIDDDNTYKLVSYNVTISRLMDRVRDMDLGKFYADYEGDCGLGALISMAGGLSDNIKLYAGFGKVMIQTVGYTNIFPYFDHYAKTVTEGGELPFLVDALNCSNGCNFGTATSCGVERQNEVTFSAHRVREKAYRSGNVPSGLSYEQRVDMLNNRFSRLALSSFVRQYDLTRAVGQTTLSEDTVEEIYQSMYKYTYEQRHTDCGACGYRTCREMVYAVGTHCNQKENCIKYSKERIRQETEKTQTLLEEIFTMNEELKKAAQLKSNFLANMSHEIRTPMNAVIGMAEMALRGELPDDARDYIKQIKSSGRSLVAIINDILDFTKIETGKMEINETQYAIISLIRDTVNIVMTRIREKEITLEVEVDPAIPAVLAGDDIRIKQVLMNLTSNAVKFTESGCVGISLGRKCIGEQFYLVASVKDTGIGIKEEDMDKLFNSFQQVDSKRNRNIEGTGLGLAISREFIKLMGGEIEVESVYGKGSIFTFWIPQRVVEDRPNATVKCKKTIQTVSYIKNLYVNEGFSKAVSKFNIENKKCSNLAEVKEACVKGADFLFIDYPLLDQDVEEYIKLLENTETVIIVDPRRNIVSSKGMHEIKQPVYSYNLARLLNDESTEMYESYEHPDVNMFEAPDARILIVDDNAINLTVAQGLLSPFHMDITLASNAVDAIRMIEEKEYDIVFMDHMMPNIDGVEATHMIREKEGEYYRKLPIIALTADAVNEAKEMLLREGMDDFVAKPIDMVDITAKIKKWLPPEKIRTLQNSGKSMEKSPEDEMSEAEIEGIDVKAGLALSGGSKLYRKVLGDYYAVIEKKADLIEKLETQGDIEYYTIEVHALKSASRLIGATELSELAAHLEKCGRERDFASIKNETPKLLELYRGYMPILASYKEKEEDAGIHDITREQLSENLSALIEALDNFDLDCAVTIMRELRQCRVDGQECEICGRLGGAVDDMEYDEAAAIAREWRERL